MILLTCTEKLLMFYLIHVAVTSYTELMGHCHVVCILIELSRQTLNEDR